MYRMKGRDEAICRKCKRPSCIYPKVCPNLNTDHRPLLDIYHAVDALPGIKKSFIGSGVRYDLLLHQSKNPDTDKSTQEYTRELIARHVSGRLKVAPEHTSDRVLNIMRKPSFSQFGEFKKIFDRINREEGLRQQLIPYFISSHPGCKEEDMAELAVITKRLDFHLEQVQDPYSHDRCHRSMVHGLPSLYVGTGVQRQDATREAGATPVLLLVQTRGTQEHHKRTAPDRTGGFDRQAIR